MNEHITYLGIDLGDKWNYCCRLDQAGEVVRAFRVRCCSKELSEVFEGIAVSVVAIEACTHSPWISRLAEAAGHKILVGNPRKLRGALFRLLETIERLTADIRAYDKAIEQLREERYASEMELLRSIPGIGALTSLCFDVGGAGAD